MVDLGFLKGGFCSAEEWKLSYAQPEVESKKILKRSLILTLSFFPLFQPCFPFFLTHYFFMKTTVIEYIDVTVLLKSLNLTALLEYLI